MISVLWWEENYTEGPHSLLPLLTITVSGILEVKAKCSYKVIDMVTHSVCTTHSIIEIIIRADNLQGP